MAWEAPRGSTLSHLGGCNQAIDQPPINAKFFGYGAVASLRHDLKRRRHERRDPCVLLDEALFRGEIAGGGYVAAERLRPMLAVELDDPGRVAPTAGSQAVVVRVEIEWESLIEIHACV